MSPVPSLLISPGESRTRTSVLTPTLSPSVATVPGAFGAAWALEEATTNLLTVASFEESSRGSYWSGIVNAPTVSDAAHGVVVIRFPANGLLFSLANVNTPAIPGGSPVTLSIFVRAMDANQSSKVRLYGTFWNDSSRSGTYDFLNTNPLEHVITHNDWRRYVVTGIVPPTRGAVSMSIATTLTAGSIELDAAQIEAKDHATSFTTGTREPGAIRVPLATPPATLLIRYIENGQHHTAVLHAGDTTFGAYGVATHTDGVLTLSTTCETAVEAALAYDTVLPEPEIARITAMGQAWTFNNLLDEPYSIIAREVPAPFSLITKEVPALFSVIPGRSR